jgi:acyl-CoA synthetase (AMP-forming)/AMP-acid ligase II
MSAHTPSAPSLQRWGHEITIEQVKGVPFRIYSRRPRRIEEILAFADRWGSRPHIVQGGRELTFDGLRSAVGRKARYLSESGVTRRQRVLILGWNSPDWIVNFWACLAVGAVPVLANAWWSEVEVGAALRLTQPVLTLADPHGAAKLPSACSQGRWEADTDGDSTIPDLADRSQDEDDPGIVIFTSGTEGRPKAAVLPHRSLLANLQMLLHISHRLPHELTADSGDVALHTGPLFHIGGSQMLLRSVTVGNTIVMPTGRFDPGEALELIERHEVTRWAAVPTMASRLISHPDARTRDLRSLRALTLGGAPIHPELLERIAAVLPGVNTGVPSGYGLTENGGQATAASGRDTVARPGTAGRPLPCVELRLEPRDGVTDGEILVRSPTQMSGYAGTVESPIDDDGWLHTGDLGRFDDEGYLWITGRCKDLIIRGGENIAPAAVEQALMSIPGVAEAAVIGVPHSDLGEEVVAFVVENGQHTPETLSETLRGSVASFAVPTQWHLQQESLPVNHTGKVDKPALATLARHKTGR